MSKDGPKKAKQNKIQSRSRNETWHKTAKDGNWKKRSVFRSGHNKAAENEEVEEYYLNSKLYPNLIVNLTIFKS